MHLTYVHTSDLNHMTNTQTTDSCQAAEKERDQIKNKKRRNTQARSYRNSQQNKEVYKQPKANWRDLHVCTPYQLTTRSCSD